MDDGQVEAVQQLMAKGYSRVQATKIFYEQSVNNYYSKHKEYDGCSIDEASSITVTL